ncbi:hypothetical protein EHS13_24095 [Paenibacillus psychroresistens]|uniref:Ricin B lectin domain-containing protein n=1 Tax=Paenibacillus psychroresistens TaxID=1778678 RepID=A0A6B8RPH6_9BACL|nr:RICIN domain-containing protein [Paenibacillus psychroresistens]QGQ97747.1 hypothetical protein EHS13_24095 [Paenibacillus psychroresistens]
MMKRAGKKKIMMLIMSLVMIVGLVSQSAFAANNQVDFFKPVNSKTDEPWGSVYPRAIELKNSGAANGTLINTFQAVPATGVPAVFPVYKSTDGGTTWIHLSDISDTQNGGWYFWSSPTIYELPAALGSLPAGTLLAAGQLVDGPDHFTRQKMELYKSTDHGATWSYLSTLVDLPWVVGQMVWEASLFMDGSTLIFYLSDETDYVNHSQKIDHMTSTNGTTWSARTDDVAVATTSLRPGMPNVAKMGNGQYIMTYEVVGTGSAGRIYYKISNSATSWNPTNLGTLLAPIGMSTIPESSPYVVWTPTGGPNGMVIISARLTVNSDNRGGENYVNYNYGVGPWYRMSPVIPYTSGTWASNNHAGYSRNLVLSADLQTLYHFTDANYNFNTGLFLKESVASTKLGILAGQSYKLVSKQTGKALTVASQSTADGAIAIISDDVENPGQEFEFIANGDGTYHIKNSHGGKMLAVNGNSTAQSVGIIQWSSDSLCGEKWTLDQQTTGEFKIRNSCANMLLDVRSAGTANGTVVQSYADGGQLANQLWAIVYANTPVQSGATYKLINPNSEKGLDVSGAGTTDGTNVQVWDDYTFVSQKWTVTQLSDGTYKVVNPNSGKALDVSGAGTADGTNVQIWTDYNGSPGQKWNIVYIGKGLYKLINPNSGKALDVNGAGITNGTNVQIWTDLNGSVAQAAGKGQQWSLTKIN